MECGNLQLCAGLEAGIEGTTHDVGHRRLEVSRARQREEAVRRTGKESENEEAG